MIVPVNFSKYGIISGQVKRILAQYDPHFSSAGLDEAYLDFTDHCKYRITTSDDERTFKKHLQGVICKCSFRATLQDWTESKHEDNRKQDTESERFVILKKQNFIFYSCN